MLQHKNARSHRSSLTPVLVFVLIVAVLAYVAYRMKVIPKAWLAALGLDMEGGGGGGDGSAGTTSSNTGTASAGGPVGTSSREVYTPVTGSVVFEGAPPNIGKVSCASYTVDAAQKEAFVEDDACKPKVDPCDLIGTSLDAAPVCHTVDTLCKSKVVPWNTPDVCSLQERGSLDAAGTNNLRGVTVPQGIRIDVNRGSKCEKSSVESKVCTASQGCTWSQDDYHTDYGYQFGLAPGYKLTCAGKVHHGLPPKSLQ